jgi:hypothetical protein
MQSHYLFKGPSGGAFSEAGMVRCQWQSSWAQGFPRLELHERL